MWIELERMTWICRLLNYQLSEIRSNHNWFLIFDDVYIKKRRLVGGGGGGGDAQFIKTEKYMRPITQIEAYRKKQNWNKILPFAKKKTRRASESDCWWLEKKKKPLKKDSFFIILNQFPFCIAWICLYTLYHKQNTLSSSGSRHYKLQ